MTKTWLLILSIGLLFNALLAQYPVNWTNYLLINPGSDVTRSLAYNRATDHVLVATRKYGTDVVILNAVNGDSVGKLDTGIIEGGTYHINMVGVADDGIIYVSNLSAPQYTPGSKVKIYRYLNENAAPELVFEDALDGNRYGDSFTAVGSGNNKYIYISGMGNSNLALLRDEGGASLIFDKYLPLPQPGAARHGISPVSPGGKVWINGADTGLPPPQLINHDGTVIAVVPDTLASAGGTSTITHLILGDFNLITVTNAWSQSIRSVRFFEDELGTVSFDYFGANSDSIPLLYNGNTFVNNVNATNSLDYDSKRHCMLTLFGVNSIASLSLDSLLKASTPRSEELTISIDGKNDFFPIDHVGTSNGREMYLTWSEGKLFVGITGHTLIDPSEKNRLYVAFDLDPSGENGSKTPPENAAGVTQLPFLADVVYMIEPWNEADFLIGNIYKWNDTEWGYTQFDGNMAAQGALAYAAEGPRKLAEIAAIKNDKGIGTDFSNMGIQVYVAEKNASGNVLCAFPDVNPIGNQVAFRSFFYVDSLGSGMFPTDTKYVQIKEDLTDVEQRRFNPGARNFRLHQNYPNPFNPKTSIAYETVGTHHIQIEIYDTTGRLVETLVNKKQPGGQYQIKFTAPSLSSGLYFYRILADGKSVGSKKMVLMK